MKKAKNQNRDKYILLSTLTVALIALFIVIISVYVRQRVLVNREDMNGADTAYYGRHFAMITSEDNEYWKNVYEGALTRSVDSDTYIERIAESLDDTYSVAKQLEFSINANVDGIMIEPDGSKEVQELIDRAVDNNIPVVTLFQDASDSKRVGFVGVSYYSLGQQYAEQIVEAIRHRRLNDNNGYETTTSNYYHVEVLMDSNIIDSARNIVYSSIAESLNAREDIDGTISISPQLIDSKDTFEVEEAIRNIFLSDEALPDVIVSLDEKNTSSLGQMLVDYNQVGKVEIIGFYLNEAIAESIDKKILYSTVGIDAYEMGRYAVDALNEYLNTGFSSDYYSVNSFVVNSNNIADFIGGDDYE